MSRKSRVKGSSRKTESRLEIIRQRHRELILERRELFGEGFAEEFDDPFEDMAREAELVDVAQTGR